MKLIIREYLASLKEREELDAILPDLLSELGFTVISRPQRGTTQHGVDIAAIGRVEDEDKIFLFSIKKGDLTRQDWDGTPQALRPSLNEILDVYIPTRIPPEYAGLKIVICLCFGGDVREQVQASIVGFTKSHSTDLITFEQWNGDKIAGLLLDGVLREDLLPKPWRSSFQKAVAMLDEPDIAYDYFARLAGEIRTAGASDDRTRLRSARQIYICVWILFVWGRDIGNTEAPYRASELAILSIWDLVRPLLGNNSTVASDLTAVLNQSIELHLLIASAVLERILPSCSTRHALSAAVRSQAAVDVNLALFDILGRIAMRAIWQKWLLERAGEPEKVEVFVSSLFAAGADMIENNPCLRLPISDEQSTSIGLFLQMWLASNLDTTRLVPWLLAMADRLDFSIRARYRYPTAFVQYRDLIEHPRNRTDEYFREATAGSTLIPLLASWLKALQQVQMVSRLSELVSEELEHCTLQLWSPDRSSEEHIYVNSDNHGRALCDLPILPSGGSLLESISDACKIDSSFEELSAVKFGYWPLVLLACRHWKLPVPPEMWIESLYPGDSSSNAADP